MIGYVVVVVLVIVALTAVVIALNADRPQAARERVWVALAASDGTGEGLPDPAHGNWIALIAATLPPWVAVHNLSIGGLTLDVALGEPAAQTVMLRPDVVTVWLVVNDFAAGRSRDVYLADLDRLLVLLDPTGAQIAIGNMPNLSTVPRFAADPVDDAELAARCAAWNAGIAEVASRHGATVIDLFTQPVEPSSVGSDGFHPSTAGQARLAAAFGPWVRRALGLPPGIADSAPPR
ncbi:MAG: hypothetical protein IT337_15535 [Thermomicrobiales bacterium]|nr:hypothetical protein [Thermomicrobiales bacterium]